MWNAITGIVAEIKKCESAGATAAAVAMAYICIDTMAYLSMPKDRSEQRRQDFIDWVNSYLKADPTQPYQYAGTDVYAGRCALLHAFGVEAKMHREDPSIKMFGYHDGGRHKFDPNISPNLVILGTASFLNDVVIAVQKFIEDCQTNAKLRDCAEARLPAVNLAMPLSP